MNGSERRARLAEARLYLCTPVRDDFESFLDEVLAAGLDIVQLRDKEAGDDEILRASETARVAADRHGALFIVNDRPDLAVAADADGVHVGQDDTPAAEARAVVGDEALVGLSTHSVEEARAALTQPVDYLGAGPVYPTPTKPGRPGVGLATIGEVARIATLPFFVTGGMDGARIPPVQAAGASRFVVVRAITEARDPAAAVRGLRRVIDR